MPAPAGQLDLELVDDEEVIVGGVLEVDELDRLRAAVVPLRQTIDDRALEQQFRRCLVHFHQPVPGRLLQIANSAGDAHVIQPRLPLAQIKLSECCSEPALEQNLSEGLTLSEFGDVSITVQPLPAHCLELLAKGLLNEVIFPLDFHSVAQLTLRRASPTLPAATPVRSF